MDIFDSTDDLLEEFAGFSFFQFLALDDIIEKLSSTGVLHYKEQLPWGLNYLVHSAVTLFCVTSVLPRKAKWHLDAVLSSECWSREWLAPRLLCLWCDLFRVFLWPLSPQLSYVFLFLLFQTSQTQVTFLISIYINERSKTRKNMPQNFFKLHADVK